MNYLLYGIEDFLINLEINKIKSDFDDLFISRYDLEECSIKDIIEDANTISLFGDKKLIIVDNSYVFSRTNKKADDIDLLEDYLNNFNRDVTIIFVDRLEKIDNVKKIVKVIKTKGVIKEFNKTNNLNGIVRNFFAGYKIDNNCIELLIKKVGKNISILYQEIEKLKLYKIDNKEILRSDIEDLTCEYIEIDIFKFIENIINKNKTESIKTYKELLKYNEEPIKIIALLASKIRLMYQASILTSKGYSEDDIASILDVKKYPVHLAIVSGYKYNPKILLHYLLELADLDYGIKSGNIDNVLGLELFILKS